MINNTFQLRLLLDVSCHRFSKTCRRRDLMFSRDIAALSVEVTRSLWCVCSEKRDPRRPGGGTPAGEPLVSAAWELRVRRLDSQVRRPRLSHAEQSVLSQFTTQLVSPLRRRCSLLELGGSVLRELCLNIRRDEGTEGTEGTEDVHFSCRLGEIMVRKTSRSASFLLRSSTLVEGLVYYLFSGAVGKNRLGHFLLVHYSLLYFSTSSSKSVCHMGSSAVSLSQQS